MIKRVFAGVVFLLTGFILLFMPFKSRGQVMHEPTSKQLENLRAYLQHYVGDPNSDGNRATRYFSAFVDLQDNGTDEVIVYLSGDGWCGSGGCTTLILAPKSSSFRLIKRLTITQLPIRVLAEKSQGWHDISVWRQGGGVQPGYEADLYFNGTTYRGRDEATLRPSEGLRHSVLPGKVMIPSTAIQQSKPLYP